MTTPTDESGTKSLLKDHPFCTVAPSLQLPWLADEAQILAAMEQVAPRSAPSDASIAKNEQHHDYVLEKIRAAYVGSFEHPKDKKLFNAEIKRLIKDELKEGFGLFMKGKEMIDARKYFLQKVTKQKNTLENVKFTDPHELDDRRSRIQELQNLESKNQARELCKFMLEYLLPNIYDYNANTLIPPDTSNNVKTLFDRIGQEKDKRSLQYGEFENMQDAMALKMDYNEWANRHKLSMLLYRRAQLGFVLEGSTRDYDNQWMYVNFTEKYGFFVHHKAEELDVHEFFDLWRLFLTETIEHYEHKLQNSAAVKRDVDRTWEILNSFDDQVWREEIFVQPIKLVRRYFRVLGPANAALRALWNASMDWESEPYYNKIWQKHFRRLHMESVVKSAPFVKEQDVLLRLLADKYGMHRSLEQDNVEQQKEVLQQAISRKQELQELYHDEGRMNILLNAVEHANFARGKFELHAFKQSIEKSNLSPEQISQLQKFIDSDQFFKKASDRGHLGSQTVLLTDFMEEIIKEPSQREKILHALRSANKLHMAKSTLSHELMKNIDGEYAVLIRELTEQACGTNTNLLRTVQIAGKLSWRRGAQGDDSTHLSRMKELAEAVINREATAYGIGKVNLIPKFKKSCDDFRKAQGLAFKRDIFENSVQPLIKQLGPNDAGNIPDNLFMSTDTEEMRLEKSVKHFEGLAYFFFPEGKDTDFTFWLNSKVGAPPETLWSLIDLADPVNVTFNCEAEHPLFQTEDVFSSKNEQTVISRLKLLQTRLFNIHPLFTVEDQWRQLLIYIEQFLVPRWVVDNFILQAKSIFTNEEDASYIQPDDLDRAAVARLLGTVYFILAKPKDDNSMQARRKYKQDIGLRYVLTMVQKADERFSLGIWHETVTQSLKLYRDVVFFRVTAKHYSYNSQYAIDRSNRHGFITDEFLSELEITRGLYAKMELGKRLAQKVRAVSFKVFHLRQQDCDEVFKENAAFSDAVAALADELRARGEKIIHNANSRNAFVGLLNAVAAIILGLVGGIALSDLGYGDAAGQFTEWRLFIVSCVSSASFLIMSSIATTHDGFKRSTIIQKTEDLLANDSFCDHTSPIQRWEDNRLNKIWNTVAGSGVLLAFFGLIVAIFTKVCEVYYRYRGVPGVAEMDDWTFYWCMCSLIFGPRKGYSYHFCD